VEQVARQMPPTTAAALPAFRLGQKPKKPCEVCGEEFEVQWQGRQLCKKPSCWHAYAGIQPRTSAVPVDVRASADLARRVGRLESLMDRIADSLDRMTGSA
jgi:hypothetical protein